MRFRARKVSSSRRSSTESSGLGAFEEESYLARPVGGSERRRWQRLPIAVPFFVRGVDDRGKEFVEFTTALNISGGGALLACRRNLALSSDIWLETPTAPAPSLPVLAHVARSVKARVVRVKHMTDLGLWALQFARPLISRKKQTGG